MIKGCNMLKRHAGMQGNSWSGLVCFMQEEDKHQVTIIPRMPSTEITESIVLFCKISISLVI